VTPPGPRLLLLLPTATYRTAAFVEATRRLGVDLTVASERPSTFEVARPDALLTLPLDDLPRAVQHALDFHRTTPVTAALGVDDDTVIVATAINDALGRAGNPLPAVHAARDKALQRAQLAAAGVPVPRFTVHAADADPAVVARQAHYPAVLKPNRLSASRGVIRADGAAQLIAAWARVRRILAAPDVRCEPGADQVLVEEFVSGAEVALEGLLTGGRLRVLAIFDKPDPLDGPYFEETIYVTPTRLWPGERDAVEHVAQAATRALGLVEGPVHAELRINGRGAWLIELAARPIGGRCGAALRFTGGRGEQGEGDSTPHQSVPLPSPFSLEELIVSHALGLPLPSLEREATASGVMMIPVPGQGGMLRGVRGVAEARAVAGVEDVVITATGQQLVPWPEGNRYPGFIFARGATPDAVVGALRAAHARLEWQVDPLD
jgi:hypothetical protein